MPDNTLHPALKMTFQQGLAQVSGRRAWLHACRSVLVSACCLRAACRCFARLIRAYLRFPPVNPNQDLEMNGTCRVCRLAAMMRGNLG